MIDICATDFIKGFDVTKATVGVIGHGFVGSAIDAFFRREMHVLVNDRAKPELQTLSQVVAQSEVIFVCIPTPMRKDGSCYTGFVEEVLTSVRDTAVELSRPMSSFVVVIKSTVPPGFTQSMSEKLPGLRVVFSPEFLTEAAAVQDMLTVDRVILGGSDDDTLIVGKYFYEADRPFVDDDRRKIFRCGPTVAEMVKLSGNGLLTAKVAFCNELYQMCLALGIDWEAVRQLVSLDRRIGPSHTRVPGPDGKLSYGGHCFPKDISSLKTVADNLGVSSELFQVIIKRNGDLRPEKDWETMKNRAVTDN
jgi:UDPglucose 6-dehydrogenase